ncbi:hypothetical protein [Adhaeribacter terreus]|uniref:Uncharacterized protein n=1 Tax=Adhaeribacter terreus TaxID=529703 RepID=A0ABW0E8P9_9BACT
MKTVSFSSEKLNNKQIYQLDEISPIVGMTIEKRYAFHPKNPQISIKLNYNWQQICHE